MYYNQYILQLRAWQISLICYRERIKSLYLLSRQFFTYSNNDVLVESSVDTTLTKDIKRQILTYLDGKYSDVETAELMDLASFLDPRFITDYISNSDLPIVKDRLIREGSEILESSSDAIDT